MSEGCFSFKLILEKDSPGRLNNACDLRHPPLARQDNDNWEGTEEFVTSEEFVKTSGPS
jgi:hypothetical protein